MQERQLGSTEFALGDSYALGAQVLNRSWEPPVVFLCCSLHSACCLWPQRTCDPMIPLNSTLKTLSVKSCVNRDCFNACGAKAGPEKRPRLWSLVSPLSLSSFEAHLLPPSHAVSYSNSSDRHAPGMRFSSA